MAKRNHKSKKKSLKRSPKRSFPKRSPPQRQLYPRKVKPIIDWNNFKKTPEAYLSYIKNILGTSQLDIWDHKFRQYYKKKETGYIEENIFTKNFIDLKYFFKIRLIQDNFMFIPESCFLFVSNFGDSKHITENYSIMKENYDTYYKKKSIKIIFSNDIKGGFNFFEIFNKELFDYLKKPSEEQETKLLYIDVKFDFGDNGITHICCGIYDSKTRLFLLLDTQKDKRWSYHHIDEVKIAFKKTFDITFLAFPENNENLQKIDISLGNCTQWRFVIPYYFIESGAKDFFKFFKVKYYKTAFRIMQEFYKLLDNFTIDDFNRIASKFLCRFNFLFREN